MCMLTAVYPTAELSNEMVGMGKVMIAMLLEENARTGNTDGTGFYSLSGTLNKWDKSALNLVYTEEFNKVVDTMVHSGPFIAHVRAISSGLTAKEGAHPFLVDGVALAHNGTLGGCDKYVSMYRTELKGEADPVDSHVLTCILAHESKGTVTAESIQTTLKQITGSYALLIANNQTMWVVPGAHSLYICRIGPFLVANTSSVNLNKVGKEVKRISRLVHGNSMAIEEPELIKGYTINTLGPTGLVKHGDIPKPVTATGKTFHGIGGWDNSPYLAKKVTVNEALTNATRVFDMLISIPWLTTWEVEVAASIGLDKHWWDATKDELESMLQTFKASAIIPAKAKVKIWDKILAALPSGINPYVLLADKYEINFPYGLNEINDLEKILEAVRSGEL